MPTIMAILCTLIWLIAQIAGATAANAQPLRVRSGEHQDFSRLVLQSREVPEWNVRQIEDGYAIDLEPARDLDLSFVFERIPRTRIANVSQSPEGGALEIELACECVVSVFEAGPGVLAIDVLETEASAREPARPVAERAQPVDEPALPILLPQLPLSSSRPSPIPWGYASEAADPPAQLEETLESQNPHDPRVPFDAVGSSSEVEKGASDRRGLKDLGRTLESDLRRAADAGVIDLLDPPPGLPAGDHRPIDNANVALRSAIVALGGQMDPGPDDPDLCRQTDFFDFMSRSSPTDILERLPTLRSGLIDDRWLVSRSGAEDLLHAYLSLSFGAEALALLPDADLPPRRSALYASLANVLDNRSDAERDLWRGLERCNTPTALWALLGQPPGVPSASVNVEAVQQAFFALPAHTRLHIGHELVGRLVRAERPAAAASISNNLSALVLEYRESTLETQSSDSDARKEAVSPLLRSGSAERDILALLGRLETVMRSGRHISDDDLDLSSALASEYSGREEGVRLGDALLLGALQAGNLSEGLARIEERRPAADRSWNTAFRRAVSSTLVSQGDAGILQVALHPDRAALRKLITDEDALEIADRLTVNGFPNQALEMLAGRRRSVSPQATLAEAQALLTAGDARSALALLAARRDVSAARVRAGSLAALDVFDLAASAYESAGDAESAARMAWLSGDPDVVSQFGSDNHRHFFAKLESFDRSALRQSYLRPGPRPLVPDVSAEGIVETAVNEQSQPGAEAGLTQAPSVEDASGVGGTQVAPLADDTVALNSGVTIAAAGEPSLAEYRLLLEQGQSVRDLVSALEAIHSPTQ